jgi:hypothetical protein
MGRLAGALFIYLLAGCGGGAQNLKCGPDEMGGNYEHSTLGSDVKLAIYPTICKVNYSSIPLTGCYLSGAIAGDTATSGTLNFTVEEKVDACGDIPMASTCAYQFNGTTLTLACQDAGLAGDFIKK